MSFYDRITCKWFCNHDNMMKYEWINVWLVRKMLVIMMCWIIRLLCKLCFVKHCCLFEVIHVDDDYIVDSFVDYNLLILWMKLLDNAMVSLVKIFYDRVDCIIWYCEICIVESLRVCPCIHSHIQFIDDEHNWRGLWK